MMCAMMMAAMDEYQKAAKSTAIYNQAPEVKYHETRLGAINYCTLGLIGEAGELANKVKKIHHGNHMLNLIREDLIAELGDVLWYVAMLAYELDVDLSDVAVANLQKLAQRQKQNNIRGIGDKR